MARRVFQLLLLSVLFVPAAYAQQFYQWKDQKGRWNFSDFPPAGVTQENVKVIFYPPGVSNGSDPYHQGYREGYNLGFEEGYKEYYKKRYEQGRQQGYKEGYRAWRADSPSRGSSSSP
jgi:hypothetical protein